jgi:hypothetical protein
MLLSISDSLQKLQHDPGRECGGEQQGVLLTLHLAHRRYLVAENGWVLCN